MDSKERLQVIRLALDDIAIEVEDRIKVETSPILKSCYRSAIELMDQIHGKLAQVGRCINPSKPMMELPQPPNEAKDEP